MWVGCCWDVHGVWRRYIIFAGCCEIGVVETILLLWSIGVGVFFIILSRRDVLFFLDGLVSRDCSGQASCSLQNDMGFFATVLRIGVYTPWCGLARHSRFCHDAFMERV